MKMRFRDMCKAFEDLNLEVPEGATKKQLESLIDEFYKTAAVVSTAEGPRIMYTDKPTEEYLIPFTISGYHCIRAESEEIANKWLKENCTWEYNNSVWSFDKVKNWSVRRSYSALNSNFPSCIAG